MCLKKIHNYKIQKLLKLLGFETLGEPEPQLRWPIYTVYTPFSEQISTE
jgi:hypothetical protein